jgi:hypothetical protein
VFKNRVMRKAVETKVEEWEGGVKYYLDDEIKDMRWAGHVEGKGREKTMQHFVWEI